MDSELVKISSYQFLFLFCPFDLRPAIIQQDRCRSIEIKGYGGLVYCTTYRKRNAAIIQVQIRRNQDHSFLLVNAMVIGECRVFRLCPAGHIVQSIVVPAPDIIDSIRLRNYQAGSSSPSTPVLPSGTSSGDTAGER